MWFDQNERHVCGNKIFGKPDGNFEFLRSVESHRRYTTVNRNMNEKKNNINRVFTKCLMPHIRAVAY